MIIKYIEDKTWNILVDIGITQPTNIDVLEIAKYLQVDVQSAKLEADISGLFVIKENKAYIRYNENEGEYRRRFTIAHELGHYMLHKDTPLFVDKNEKVMFRNSQSTTGEIMKEREANAFAAALLMPKFFIEQEIYKVPLEKDIITHLAEIFNVSQQAMSFRLSNLDYDLGLF